MNLYNSLSRKKEVLKPIHKNSVGLYTCGPTVYNYAHIGNLRTYIFEDVLERALEYNGYRVKRVMNITDVGHLTGDSDYGEDKAEVGAKREKKSTEEIAEFYTKAFLADLKKLNIKIPKTIAPATQYIKEQQELIGKLFDKGLAYETETAVYFDVKKYGLKKYLKLSRQPLDQKITGARNEVVVDPRKKNPADFVLWFKLVGKFKNHILRWPSPWGEGFPGWHIECSAISRHFLGQPFDIHTGGVDHIGTHHTNEIAQSEAAYGLPLAHIWMHGEFLLIDKSKMAKSEGNFFTLANIEKRGINPLAFRYLVLQTHYRSKLNFSWDGLRAAQEGLRNLYREVGFVAWSKETTRKDGYPNYETTFKVALNDDLNTSRALAVVWEVLKGKRLDWREKLTFVRKFDEVLCLELEKATRPLKIDPRVSKLAQEREKYRTSKQFMQSDALRKEINGLGYEVEDTSQGPFLWPNNL